MYRRYTPRYSSHVPRISINTQNVASTFGDATEEYLVKRVVRGTLDESKTSLARILPEIPAVPESVENDTYRKTRMTLGRAEDKAGLQRTFSRTYRNDNPKLTAYARSVGKELLSGTLKTPMRLRQDMNATPFPPTPRYH